MQPIVSAVRRFLGDDGSVKAFLDEVFRERELILRSQGRVHFLLLTRRLQMSVAAIVLAVAVWGIGMTLMSTLKSGVIQVKNEEIREARVAYEDLFEEVLSYQKKVAAVTSNLRESQDDLLEQFGTVVQVEKKAGKPKAKPNRRAAKAKSVGSDDDPAAAELRGHLAEIDRKVQQMTETNVLLEGSLGKIKTELQLAGDERRGKRADDSGRVKADPMESALGDGAQSRRGFDADETLNRDILGHARKRLGPAVAPREIVFRESLPKTRSGKIMRRLLKARELGLPEGDLSTLESDER